jgi:hypothetical protein
MNTTAWPGRLDRRAIQPGSGGFYLSRKPLMAKYRRIAIRIWGDEKFRTLSKPGPNAQTLWLYLLTGEHTLSVPGLSCAGEQALAEAIGWPISAFRRCFSEIAAKEMAEADWNNRVLWLPNAVHYNPPESVNVIKAWVKSLDAIPECPLKQKGIAKILVYLEVMTSDKSEAFFEAFHEGIKEDKEKAFPLQKQKQKQKQNNPSYPPGGRWPSRYNPDPRLYTCVGPGCKKPADEIFPDGSGGWYGLCRGCMPKCRKADAE